MAPEQTRLLLVVLITSASWSFASHFRGAIIMWKPGIDMNQVVVDYRISWRKTYSSLFDCDANTIQSQTVIGGEGSLKCYKNCLEINMGPLYYKCTDYSDSEDWSSGLGTIQHAFSTTSLVHEFGFSGTAWIDTLNYGRGGDWYLWVKADLSVRNDTGKVNSSPTAQIPPIVRLQHGCNHTITIPVQDSDGDVVKCVWASSRDNQCGSVCDGFPKSSLHSEICEITYAAIYETGWFAVAIQVEDYKNANSSIYLSSIPLQFLVNVYTSPNESCTKTTEFIYPTPPEDACIGVPEGASLQSAIVARVYSKERSVSEIKTLSPVGLTHTEIYNVSATDWRVNFTYQPPNNSDVTNVFCFIAKETSGLESDKRCITLLAGVTAPSFVNGSQSPTKRVHPSQRRWSIGVDSAFELAVRHTFVRLFSSDRQLLERIDASDKSRFTVENYTLNFITTSTLQEDVVHYFTFDFGVVQGIGKTHCGAESFTVDDPSFWSFLVRDVTPPKITWLTFRRRTNSSAEIKWSFDEVVNSTCTLTSPNGFTVTFTCKNNWAESGLVEGTYNLDIYATDVEGNVAINTSTWIVDTTPPVLTLTTKPAYISNEDPVVFKWTCQAPCTTTCTISGSNKSSTADCYPSTSLSWAVPLKISNVTYRFTIKATDDVGNKVEIHHEWITDFEAPLVSYCSSGQNFTVNCTASLKPETICNVTVTDNLDITPNLVYKDNPADFCGIIRTWKTQDMAGNVGIYNQSIRVFNDKRMSILRVPGPMSIACGALDNITSVITSLFKVEHPCDIGIHFSYVDDRSELDSCDVRFNRTWTIYDNCGNTEQFIQLLQIQQAKTPLAPKDGETAVNLNTYLQWESSIFNMKYEVYLWIRGFIRPENATQVSYKNHIKVESLQPATRYQWQIVYHFPNDNTYYSPIWVFETVKFADLVVRQIIIPPSGFTGQICQVKWTVENIGNITTETSYWTDAVYLSWDTAFNNALQVAQVNHRGLLYVNDGYSVIATFMLEERKWGRAYIKVHTDIYNQVAEYNKTNNKMTNTSSSVDVQRSPSPNLLASLIRLSDYTAFSGNTITVSWTIVNVGTGPTKHGFWHDLIWLSSNTSIEKDAKELSRIEHVGNLGKNESYNGATTILIPEFISGNFYIIIQVDYFDVVFEGFDDNNTFPVERPINVLLTQVPDLQVNSIQTANLWKTGETVNIKWTVQNFGNRSPLSQQFWQDSVAIVSHTKKEIVGVTSHFGVLESDETYTASMYFYISPDISSGNFNLTVWTDYRDALFEHDYNDNNELNKTITVLQSFPDLKIIDFSVMIVYENESTKVFANWTTENIGIGNTLSNSWTDSVQVLYSAANNFDALQHTIKTENSLRKFEKYEVLDNFTIPFTIYGDVRFRVQSDIFRTTGDTNNNNNIRESSKISLRLRAVDFIVSESLSITENLQGGQKIVIVYTVTNNGTRNVGNSTWRDRIFISNNINNNTAFYDLNAISMISKDVMQQEKYSSTASFILPKELSGFYFVHVDVNYLQDIFEGEIKNNKVTKTIFIETAPVADLCVTSVVVSTPSSVGEEQLLLIEWWVKNIGNSMDSLNSWHDRVLFKHETDLSFTDFQQTFSIRNNLESQAPYRVKRQIALPSYMSGKIKVCVETDVFKSVYETNTRQNNLNCSNVSVSIKSLPPAKLLAKLDTVSMNDGTELLIPGSIAKIKYSVRNTGGLPTHASSWTDSIYIVNSNVYTVSDIKRFGYRVNDALHIGVLSPNETYSVISSFTLPKTFSNQSSIYVLANNTETTEESNVGIAFYHQRIQISNNLPNLLIQSNATIKNMQGGQPLTVEYKIKNTGRVIIDNEISWYDSTLLSEDFNIDAFDIKLMTVDRSMRIEAGEEVMVNITYILPLNLQTKTYVLVIMCDSRDDLFEENENDNQLQFVFNIERRASTDIVVSKIIVPLNAEIGGYMEIRWNVTNSGTSNAIGYKCDSIYLSHDEEWDIDDAQIGAPICSKFSIAGNSSDNHVYFLKSKTPDVASSSYNTIVKIRSNIDDVDLENNIAVADQQTTISYPVLALNTTLFRQLESNDGVAIRITNVLADETLVVNITSDNEDAFNNVYIKAGYPATLFDFDKISDRPNEPNQIVSVPNTKKGDYYILVQNSGSLVDEFQQNITVHTKYAEFEILNIFPSSLLPGSQTTMRFDGTLIPYDTKVSLSSRNGTSFEAFSTYIYSSTEAYATFILPKDVHGTQFSLTFTSSSLNTSLVLPDSVSVKRGVQGFLVTSTDAPRNLRVGETGLVKVNLQNAGDSDLLVPVVIITALGDGELRLIDETTSNQFSQNFFIIGSPKHGPAGILPPKTYTTIQFETRPTQEFSTSMNLTISVLKVDKNTSNPFLEQKELFRPSHYDEMSWDIVWKRFIAVTGNTTFSLVSKLSETLNEMSLAGRYVRNVDEIMQYLLKTADSSYVDRILLRIIEFEIPSDLNVPMLLDRYLSTRIGSRSQTGPMGKGWILPLWDSAIKQYDEKTSILTISLEKEDYEFIGLNDTFFIHENFGSVTKTTTEYRHRLFKGDKEYRFDVNNLRLIKIVSLVDESFLDLEYENNLLVKIQHSSGYFIDVGYDSYGRIQMMQLKGHSASRVTGPVLFTYDFDSGMLLEARHQSTRTRYSYNKEDYSLYSVENSDGSSIVFAYSASGEVISRKVIQGERVIASREYSYSSSGQVSIHTQPENKTYNVTFDETGTVILIQRNGFLPDKTVMTSISEIQYDGEMVVTKRTLQDNEDTFVIEDGNEDGIGATFNDKGQLVAFMDGEGNQYQITLNLNGSLKLISFPDGTNKSYTYLQNGHSVMTQTGAIKRFEYNQERKLAMKDIGNGSINTYSYDMFGRIQNILNENAKIVVSNENDKITQFAYPDHSINYTYNEDNQITSISTSSGYVVKYEYYDNGHIHYVKDKENKIILTADYTDSGQVSKKTLGNNSTTIYTYDPVTGLLLDMLNYFPNGSVASFFKYKYSLRNRRISIETHEGVWKFGYDRAGQVVLMVDPKGTRTEYSYDKKKKK